MTIALNGPTFVGANVSSMKKILLPGLPTVSATLLRAYGLRLLNASYTGPLVRLRRGSDNVEADFQFITDAVLWAGAASAYITTYYDQSGYGKHLVAPAATNQPRVINAGVLETIGTTGRAKAVFDGTDDYLLCAGGQGMYAAGALSVFGVVSGAAGTTRYLLTEGNSGNINPVYAPVRLFSQTLTQQLSNDLGGNPLPPTSTAEAPYVLTAAGAQFDVIDTGAVIRKGVGGVALADVAYTRASTVTTNQLCLGAMARTSVSSFFAGGFAELPIYGAALSDADRNLIRANQNAYFGFA